MLKGAIIGLGKIAQTAHIPAYLSRRINNKIEIVSGVDISKSNSEAFLKLVPGVKIFSNADEMFKNLKIDFVDICVPPHLHFDYIKAALKNNVAIICEKPFTKSVKDAKLLKKKLIDSKTIFFPCHQYKYSPIWNNFKNFSKKNKSGIFLQFNIFRSTADKGFDNKNPGWRTNKKFSGGGILSDTGTHYLYLTSWILGKPKELNVLNFKLRQKPYSVEDTSIAILKCEKGITEINLTWAADKRANSAFITNGKKSLTYDGKKMFSYEKEKTKEISVPDASDKRTYIAFYEDLFLDFTKAMKSKKFDKLKIEESYESVRILENCYKSAVIKKSIRL
jgi:predicted dehydrogenase